MGILDEILGPPWVQPPKVPSKAEQAVLEALKTTRPPDYAAPRVSDQTGPFSEILLNMWDVPNPGWPFNAAVANPASKPYVIPISGHSLLYRQQASSPQGRLLILLGSQLHVFSPGQFLEAAFDSVTLVRRLNVLSSELAGYDPPPSITFEGDIGLVIGKEKGYKLVEPNSGYNAGPFFRPVQMYGPGDISSASVWGPVVVNAQGFRKIRVYVTSGPNAGDIVTLKVFEKRITYDNTLVPLVLDATFEVLHETQTLTWTATGSGLFEIDCTGLGALKIQVDGTVPRTSVTSQVWGVA